MKTLLFLLGVAVLLMFAASYAQTGRVNRYLKKRIKKKQQIPQAVSMLILIAQASELVRVVEHASLINISAALFLLIMVLATKSGTEGNSH